MVTSPSKGLESESGVSEAPTQQEHRPSREERLAKHKMQCQHLIMYILDILSMSVQVINISLGQRENIIYCSYSWCMFT